MNIKPIAAFSDNYIWSIENNGCCVLVDPGDAAPVFAYLQKHNLQLTAILITHHHQDHVGGVADLLNRFPVVVYAPAAGDYSFVHRPVAEGDSVTLAEVGCKLTVMAIPGHTLDHIAYYNDQALFCGDTLFAGGCGRIFEGTAEMMYASLAKLSALPVSTQVYCAHEYTLNNLRFAQSIDTDNVDLCQRVAVEAAKRERGEPTLPSSVGLELKTNPFLSIPSRRCGQHQAGSVNLSSENQDEVAVFAKLRELKDRF